MGRRRTFLIRRALTVTKGASWEALCFSEFCLMFLPCRLHTLVLLTPVVLLPLWWVRSVFKVVSLGQCGTLLKAVGTTGKGKQAFWHIGLSEYGIKMGNLKPRMPGEELRGFDVVMLIRLGERLLASCDKVISCFLEKEGQLAPKDNLEVLDF